MAEGRVYLIGVGPGDPELVTVKGKRIIEAADVIIHDNLNNLQALAWAKPACEIIFVGRRRDPDCLSEDEIVRIMAEKAGSGKNVARLKAGDPFLFCHGPEELSGLRRAGVAFEVVSGVTSALAAPACAGVPLTMRGISSSVGLFIISQKNLPGIQWGNIANSLRTLVFLRGVDILPTIVRKLAENGRALDTPAAIIQDGTLPRQVAVSGTLENIVEKAGGLDEQAQSIIVVGEVVKYREQLDWFTKKPLAGCRVLVTRSPEQAGQLANQLALRGAWPVIVPTIKTRPLNRPEVLRSALTELDSFDWLVFSSVNAVNYFREYLLASGRDIRDLKGLKIICVGGATAKAVTALGVRVDLVPVNYRAEGIIGELRKMDLKNQRFLLPRAKKAREILPGAIREMGGEVVVAPLYETVAAGASAGRLKGLLSGKEIDVVTFTSSSTVNSLLALIDHDLTLLEGVRIAVIGPVTRKTAEKAGLEVSIMPASSTMEGLVGAIEAYYN